MARYRHTLIGICSKHRSPQDVSWVDELPFATLPVPEWVPPGCLACYLESGDADMNPGVTHTLTVTTQLESP